MNEITVEPREEVIKTNGHGKVPGEVLAAPKAPGKSRRLLRVAGSAPLVAVIAAVPAIHSAYIHESTDDAFIDGHIITIAPKIAGQVLAVHVADNELVKD